MFLSIRSRAILARSLAFWTCLIAPLANAQPCPHWQQGAPFNAVPSADVLSFAVQTAGGANELWAATRGGAQDQLKHTDGSGLWTTEPPLFPTVRYTAAGVWNQQPVFAFYDDASPTTRGVAIRTSGGSWNTFSAPGFANVRAFTVLGSTLHAVGIGEVSGSTRGVVWANSGSGWSLIATGDAGSEFLAASTYNGQVYLGGRFNFVNSVPGPGSLEATNLARFDGAVWTEVPFSRLDGRVTALYYHAWDPTSPRGGQLIVSGDFLLAGGVNANHIAAFTDPPMGGYWHALGSGLDFGPATSFDTRNIGPASADLIVGGLFTGAGGVASTKALARWSSGAWSGTGVNFASAFPVHLTNHRGLTIIGGRAVEWMLGVRANYVLTFDGHRVHTLGRGTDHEVYDLSRSTDGNSLYAVGIFSLIENSPAAHVAVKSLTAPDAQWEPVGAGTNGYTASVLGHNGEVFIGGQFTQAGHVSAANIARWDGAAWHATPGIPSSWTGVQDLIMFNGLPTAIGGTYANNSGVAQWNGTTWQGLGPAWPTQPYYSIPSAACIHNGQLHIAGGLNLPGPGTCTVARWTGASWAAIGNGPVQAHGLASFNGELYASTSTTNNGGDSTVYRFDGANWIPLNSPFAPLAPIFELKVIDDMLYAVGAENYTGAFNGSTWHRLDKLGSNGNTVYTLEAGDTPDSSVLVGVSFAFIDAAAPSRNLARLGACLADFNCSGAVTVQDIFDFLSAYFASDSAADINASGAVSVQDIFDYLAAYFAGCP